MDADTGLVDSMSAKAANVHDITGTRNLLHGGRRWCGALPGTREYTSGRRTWGSTWGLAGGDETRKRRKMEPGSDQAVAEREKASLRTKVEHPFLKVKRIFDCGNVRYRGLTKNTQRPALLLGLGNLMTGDGQLEG